MQDPKTNRAIVVVSVALIAVMAVLLMLFLIRPSSDGEGIILPVPQLDGTQETGTPSDSETNFVVIDRQNVTAVLKSLSAPRYYHQRYQLSLTGYRTTVEHVVDVWCSNGLIHAEIQQADSVKSLLTDGDTVWIWYDSNLQPAEFLLSESVSLEDLLGIPSIDYLLNLDYSYISEAEYQVLDDQVIPCVYACIEDEGLMYQYWISLDTGLLYQTNVSEAGNPVYTIIQTAFERLAAGDQTFQGRFCLPDGSVPFTVKRETQQP